MSGDVRERLKRLLFLVPYVARHPGIGVAELARAVGVSQRELLDDLDTLACVGRPPFAPDDYIDIYVEDDRVWVDLDARLSAPPRLTAGEAAALAAAAELLRPAAGDALTAAVAKLERVLPAQARARFREMGRKVDAALEAPEALGPLTHAILERREVAFDYAAPGRPAEGRRVRPAELLSHRGQWYLQGFDLARDDARLFRVDRIEGLQLSDARFTEEQLGPARRARVPSPVREGTGGREDVTVRFTPRVAPYVRERFGADAHTLPEAQGGGVEVKVAGDSERWLVQWVLSFGGEARVVAPEAARAAVARAAEAMLQEL